MNPVSTVEINVGEEFTKRLTIHTSLEQEVVVTTVDKVRLCLIQNQEALKAHREWVMPLGILVTLLAVLLASDFKQFGLDAAVWEALFVISALFTGVWLIRAVLRAWKSRGSGAIDQVIEELKAHGVLEAEAEKDQSGSA